MIPPNIPLDKIAKIKIWRARAEECRTIGEQMRPETRAIMLNTSMCWDFMADRAERELEQDSK